MQVCIFFSPYPLMNEQQGHASSSSLFHCLILNCVLTCLLASELSLRADKGTHQLFFTAVKAGDIQTVRNFLKKKKAYINTRDYYNATPLMQGRETTSLLFKNLNLRCNQSVGLNHIFFSKNQAVLHGQAELVRFLLDQKSVAIDAKGPRNRTALHLAAFIGRAVSS